MQELLGVLASSQVAIESTRQGNVAKAYAYMLSVSPIISKFYMQHADKQHYDLLMRSFLAHMVSKEAFRNTMEDRLNEY